MTCLVLIERVRHTACVEYRSFAFAAIIWFVAATPVGATACRGEDLFPLLQARAPEAFSAI